MQAERVKRCLHYTIFFSLFYVLCTTEMPTVAKNTSSSLCQIKQHLASYPSHTAPNPNALTCKKAKNFNNGYPSSGRLMVKHTRDCLVKNNVSAEEDRYHKLQMYVYHILMDILDILPNQDLLAKEFLGLTIKQYLLFSICFLITTIIYKLLIYLLQSIFKRWTFINDKSKATIQWLISIIIIAFFLRQSILILNLTNLADLVHRVLNAMITVSLSYLAYQSMNVIHEYIKIRHSDNVHLFHMAPFYNMTARVIIILAGIISAIDSLGFKTESLIKALSMSTLGIGLAAQDPIKNLFASLMITMNKPFSVGDDISTGSIRGEVEEIGLRATLIRTKEGSLVYVPNTKLMESYIDNFGKRDKRVIFLEIPINYDVPLQTLPRFLRSLRSIIKHQPYVKQNKAVVYLDNRGDQGFKIIIKVSLDTKRKDIEYECRNNIIFLTLKVAHNLKLPLGISNYVIKNYANNYDTKLDPETNITNINALEK